MSRNQKITEARGFAVACKEYANGAPDSFGRAAFLKASEIITDLCDELSTGCELSTEEKVINKEKRESEKRHFPLHPLIEKSERAEEKTSAAAASARARTCEGCSYVGPDWGVVLKYVTHPRVNIDEGYALWWYGQMDALGWCNPDCLGEPLKNWKSMLRAWWLQRSKDGNDWKKTAEAAKPPRKYSLDEWGLCAERCCHFDAAHCRCRSGCDIPPEHRPTPATPEECVRFKKIIKEA